MKIAIATADKTLESKVCESFGRAPYFLIYDTDNTEAVYLENTAAKSSGGAGIKAAQIIADNNVEVVILPRCGGNAADVLNEAGIKLYKSQDVSMAENIENLKDGKLNLLTDIHEGFHNK